MITLDDKIWQELTGGYKTKFDASGLLKKLEFAIDFNDEQSIWSEIWDELHHQGDIGTASYYAIPQLIRIAKLKQHVDYNIFAFISTIEIERNVETNPTLPTSCKSDYLDALRQIPDLIAFVKNDSWDATLTTSILSSIAVSKGHIKLAKIILDLEDADLIDSFSEFIENY